MWRHGKETPQSHFDEYTDLIQLDTRDVIEPDIVNGVSEVEEMGKTMGENQKNKLR